MEKDTEHSELQRLIEENTEILKQNNKILRKMYRNDIIGIWVKLIWVLFLIGLPFVLYFMFESYFRAMGSSYEIFSAGIQEIPGLKQFNHTLDVIKAGEQ